MSMKIKVGRIIAYEPFLVEEKNDFRFENGT